MGTDQCSTGFFYHELNENENKERTEDNIINKWLVTNRHIIYPRPESYGEDDNYTESPVDWLKIRLNEVPSNTTENRNIPFSRKEFEDVGKIHSDPEADVAIISIKEYLCLRHNRLEYYNRFFHFDYRNLPVYHDITPKIGDEIIVLGFPQGLEDNLLQVPFSPSIEYARIITEWGESPDGFPCFKINKALKKGFSGSPVILKNNKMSHNNSFSSDKRLFYWVFLE